jgi:hypothetical protein
VQILQWGVHGGDSEVASQREAANPLLYAANQQRADRLPACEASRLPGVAAALLRPLKSSQAFRLPAPDAKLALFDVSQGLKEALGAPK